jgi:flap endonuclease-1
MEQFIDFCILSGCDYLPTIPRLGPSTALKMIKEYSSIEGVLDQIKLENQEKLEEKNELKFIIPIDFDYQTTRELFKQPNVSPSYPEFLVKPPQNEDLTKFLIEEKGFD